MLAADRTLCGRLALGSFRQLEEPACDEVTARQAANNLVYLVLPLYQRDSVSGAVPGSRPQIEEKVCVPFSWAQLSLDSASRCHEPLTCVCTVSSTKFYDEYTTGEQNHVLYICQDSRSVILS